jgi:hypothetical protein
MNGDLVSRWIPGVVTLLMGTYAASQHRWLAQRSVAFNKEVLGMNVPEGRYEVGFIAAGVAFICIGVATLAGYIHFG